MNRSVTVHAPASVSNVGPGFDILGFALDGMGDKITLSTREDEQYVIEAVGAELPMNPEKNVATVGLRSLCNHLGYKGGFDIKIEKNFTPGSGLGSSASSAAGAVFAANELLLAGLTKDELVPFALDGEVVASKNRHADNIAPCMLGGFVAVKGCDPFDAFSVDYPNDLKVLIVFPDVPIKTAEAREILPKSIGMATGISQSANMAGLITGLMRSDYELIRNSLHDEFAQPYRKQLIPHYDEVSDLAYAHEAVGFNISGSGPAMFGLFKAQAETKALKTAIEKIYNQADIGIQFHESGINHRGVEHLR
ncbi:MAG: homoserine kinase [Roseivirga sp.]|nr:homoserine kinase [Roseivirga sp.]